MTARILVVDDIPANVKLLEARLTAEYFDVATAMSGAEALALCERAQCDIVLLDVMMPEMDGFEVCRRLKANPVTHPAPTTSLRSPCRTLRCSRACARWCGSRWRRTNCACAR
jgi:CheY-like chemotaxis protein